MALPIFRALACDYDGTLASQDRLGPQAVAALQAARGAGLRLILVTGRTFFELTRVCEHLDLFDGVVAENGGVLYFPGTAALQTLAPPPPPRLLGELDRRGIAYQVGRVVVGAARGDEAAVRAALTEAGLKLDLVPNRAALMILPGGVSKGSGVQQMLRALGLSFHDAIGIGDAENDLDLFDACGWAGCPASAVPDAIRRADWSFPGDDGAAIARAIEGPILNGLLPLDRSPRQRVDLGWAAETFETVGIPARGVNVLIEGDTVSGKSWLAGALIERLHQRHYAVCVIDPEGDHRALAGVSGIVRASADSRASVDAAFRAFERDPAACVVIDLAALGHEQKLAAVERCLLAARDLRRRIGRPHWIVLDEAHYSLHPEGVASAALAVEDKGLCLVTCRSSWVRRPVLAAVEVLIFARTTAAEELAFLSTLLAGAGDGRERVVATLARLPRGTFVVVQRSQAGTWVPTTFRAPPRATLHVRHLTKYTDTGVRADHAFVLRSPDGRQEGTADSLTAFRDLLATAGEAAVAYHAGRGDFSRWVLDVFSDRELSAQLRKVEQRWGRGEVQDLRAALDALIAARYAADDG